MAGSKRGFRSAPRATIADGRLTTAMAEALSRRPRTSSSDPPGYAVLQCTLKAPLSHERLEPFNVSLRRMLMLRRMSPSAMQSGQRKKTSPILGLDADEPGPTVFNPQTTMPVTPPRSGSWSAQGDVASRRGSRAHFVGRSIG